MIYIFNIGSDSVLHCFLVMFYYKLSFETKRNSKIVHLFKYPKKWSKGFFSIFNLYIAIRVSINKKNVIIDVGGAVKKK